jgi:hypothetical protein
MKFITIKKFALIASAGVLFQLLGAGCGGLIFQLIANTVLNELIAAILRSVTGDATTTGVTE